MSTAKKKLDVAPPEAIQEELVQGEAVVEEFEVETEEVPELFGEDGKAILFPGGPSMDTVEEWRSRYKDIFLTEFDEDTVIIWRTLTRKEYKDIMKIPNADNFYKEERICERVTLWPENYSFMQMGQGKAGVPTLISELVMEKSGFQSRTGAMKL